MGICYGTPDYPTPSFTGYLRPGTATSLTISSTSSSEIGESRSFGAVSNGIYPRTGTSLTISSTSSAEIGESRSFGAVSNGIYPSEGTVLETNARVFTLSELKLATRNFRPDTVLGEGGFGKVYKGYLDEKVPSQGKSRTAIAIKKLKPESVQGFNEWRSEVNFLSSLPHPYIVELLGYCWEDSALLLVYEFMPRGTLKNHLFGRGASIKRLSWKTRLKIAIGAAKGLDFLHGLEKQIICRDFKSSNILLDGNYNAKISDFGLAKEGPVGDRSHVSTQVLGTVGYAAPEYIATGHLYVKSDVFSYGVVLVELLTGLRAYDRNRPAEQKYLVEWVKPHLSKRKLTRVMDPTLGRYPLKDALEVAALAFQCLRSDPKARPSMKEVVEKLEKIAGPS